VAEKTEAVLLARWQEGDEEALDRLLRRLLPWLHRAVRPHVGPRLRESWDLEDLVQEAVERFLVYLPRAQVQDLEHFRRLFLRVTVNLVRDRVAWLEARNRGQQPLPLPTDSVLLLPGGDGRQRDTPSRELMAREERERIAFALLLLPPRERALVVRRIYEGRAWKEIGRSLGVAADAARRRFARAISHLARLVALLDQGVLPVDFPEDEEAET